MDVRTLGTHTTDELQQKATENPEESAHTHTSPDRHIQGSCEIFFQASEFRVKKQLLLICSAIRENAAVQESRCCELIEELRNNNSRYESNDPIEVDRTRKSMYYLLHFVKAQLTYIINITDNQLFGFDTQELLSSAKSEENYSEITRLFSLSSITENVTDKITDGTIAKVTSPITKKCDNSSNLASNDTTDDESDGAITIPKRNFTESSKFVKLEFSSTPEDLKPFKDNIRFQMSEVDYLMNQISTRSDITYFLQSAQMMCSDKCISSKETALEVLEEKEKELRRTLVSLSLSHEKKVVERRMGNSACSDTRSHGTTSSSYEELSQYERSKSHFQVIGAACNTESIEGPSGHSNISTGNKLKVCEHGRVKKSDEAPPSPVGFFPCDMEL